jgi:hypothetical protein
VDAGGVGLVPEEDFYKGVAASNSSRARLHPRNDSSHSPVRFLTDRTDECGETTARPANLPQCSQSIPAYFLLRLEKDICSANDSRSWARPERRP